MRQIRRRDDHALRSEYVELGVQMTHSADGSTGFEQQLKRSNVTHSVNEILLAESRDDSAAAELVEHRLYRTGLNERRDEKDIVGTELKASGQFGVPAFLNDSHNHRSTPLFTACSARARVLVSRSEFRWPFSECATNSEEATHFCPITSVTNLHQHSMLLEAGFDDAQIAVKTAEERSGPAGEPGPALPHQPRAGDHHQAGS